MFGFKKFTVTVYTTLGSNRVHVLLRGKERRYVDRIEPTISEKDKTNLFHKLHNTFKRHNITLPNDATLDTLIITEYPTVADLPTRKTVSLSSP